MSFISNVTAYSYTDKISAITVATSPYNNTGQYYNVLYIGTSNGKLYSFTDSSSVIYPIFQIVPSTGVLTGEITGLAIDPMGKYLFVNAPYDNHCFRFSVASIPLAPATPNQTYTIPVDRDIYTYGDNTGGITVDSQGVVYIVTGRGSSISTIERYGNSFINLLFKNEGPSLNFRGITLSPNEQVIYSVDSQFGSIYYYNFLNYQPTFDILNSSGVTSSMQNITSLRNNIYYTQTDGIYVKNTYVGSVSHIIGTDSSNNITTTDPLKITISGTNTVAVDSGGSVYLSSTSYNGNSILYKTTFYLSPRSNYQAPVPRQQQPILQPYPTTSCKRIVEPFNARTRFGWGLTNTRNRPILDVVKYPLCCPPPIVNCPVTPFYCPPTPVIPTPPLLIQPVYPLTVTTRQYTDIAHATGYRPSIIVPATTLLSTSLTFTAGYSSTQPALGALGEIYSLEDSGRLTKIYKQKVVSSKTFGTQTSGASPVISMKGAVTVATNNGILYRLNSDMATLQGYPINLGKQVFGTPANITNNAFDYIVAAYGNSLTAFNADNATAVWTSTTQTPGESFRTSVTTDGINVFVGSDNKKIYCYTAETGTLNWTCSLSPSTQTLSYPYTPYATLGYIGVTYKDDSNIFIVSNTTVRVTANDFTVRLPGGLKVSSPPVLSTDPAGNLWAHVLTMSGNIQKLYGIGGIFNAARVDFPYKYIWSNASGEEIPSSYTIPVLDSSGYIYAPSTHGVLNQYYAYLATASAGQEVTQSYVSQLVLNGTITAPNPPIQVSRTPLITSQNTMYVIATNDGTTTNYLYTISS